MLPDYKQNVFSPLRYRHAHLVPIQVTFGSGNGTATLDSANSAPGGQPGTGTGGINVTGTAGVYTFNAPKGMFLHPVGLVMALPANNPGNVGIDPFPKTTSGTIDPTAGTFTVWTLKTDGTGVASPPDNARLYATFLLGKV